MNLQKIVPWSHGRNSPAARSVTESPVFALHREMDRMFDDFFRGFSAANGRNGAHGWPSVELRESDKEFQVLAELPGLEERDVEVTFADGVLTLKGEKRLEEANAVYTERWSGSFERQIPLSQDVDAEKIKATFKNGVLTVMLAKRAEAQRQVRRIAIS
ncbi:MAG TPA: Hsp20/alpha crystallin family protein [Steroidobacteraceae bacterium]|nr:Hsp20/alpha crystallin family protein [Steroidobacteraceae bacterium]